MNINDAFPSEWLKASDLQGRDVPVTIDRVEIEDLGDGDKPVLYFSGKQKGLVLNKTNSATVAGTYGPETTAWTGRPVVLFQATAMFQGRSTPCIRVRIPAQQPAAAASSDEDPFGPLPDGF